jgi:peptidoglycan/xylan/chitin deacetylase (PgdA/CDA1 family)
MSRIRHFARDVYAKTLYGFGASRLDRMPGGRLLILMLHRVLPGELRAAYPLPELAVTPQELRWLLASLVRHFDVAPVSQALDKLNDGASERPILALSFDDGQLDNLEHAAPVLDEFDVKASFYVPTDFIGGDALLWHDAAGFAWQQLLQQDEKQREFLNDVGLLPAVDIDPCLGTAEFLASLKRLSASRRAEILATLAARTSAPAPDWARLMNWEEVAQLAGCGHEIGAHGRTHELLPHLDSVQQHEEVAGSRSAVAAALGTAPRSFCYPNGSFDERTLAAVDAAGYDNAVTTRWGINECGSAQAYELLRCDINASSLVDRNGALSLPRLSLRLSGLQPGLSRFDGRLPETA